MKGEPGRGKLYHCVAATDEAIKKGVTLCNMSVGIASYDFPLDFNENKRSPVCHYEKCSVCENHPDMPLLILGDQ